MRKGLFVVSPSPCPSAPAPLVSSRLSGGGGAFINHFLSSRNPSPPYDYPCNRNKVETSQGITFFRDLCRMMECTKPSMNCAPLNPETNEQNARCETKSNPLKRGVQDASRITECPFYGTVNSISLYCFTDFSLTRTEWNRSLL